MNHDQVGNNQSDLTRFRESDSPDLERERSHFLNTSAYSEDKYRDDHEPTYQDEYGKRLSEMNWPNEPQSRAYPRPQALIREEANSILKHGHKLDASKIEVEVKNNCLYLKGIVDSRLEKRLAETMVESIPGIADIQNQLRIWGVSY